MKVFGKIKTFLQNVIGELKLVEWVSRKQVAKYTGVVIAFGGIMTISILLIDSVLVTIRSLILGASII